MDVLIYSGQELFVLDGDALLQYVLDDKLLAFAKDGDPSLQLMHATWLLERTVDDFLKKDTAFEIVFFDSEPMSSCTHTARLAHHSLNARRPRPLDVPHRGVRVRRRRSPARPLGSAAPRKLAADPLAPLRLARRRKVAGVVPAQARKSYRPLRKTLPPRQHLTRSARQPMYVLGHDGGIKTNSGELEAERILLQRENLYNTVHQSLPYVLLQAAELTDTKVSRSIISRIR